MQTGLTTHLRSSEHNVVDLRPFVLTMYLQALQIQTYGRPGEKKRLLRTNILKLDVKLPPSLQKELGSVTRVGREKLRSILKIKLGMALGTVENEKLRSLPIHLAKKTICNIIATS